MDVDLVKLVVSKLGHDVGIVSIDFDGLIPALQAGQIDVIASGMTITEDR
jgi:polar amino acid transport system substrate-binding protein